MKYNHPISTIPNMIVPMFGITEPAIIAIINAANNFQAGISNTLFIILYTHNAWLMGRKRNWAVVEKKLNDEYAKCTVARLLRSNGAGGYKKSFFTFMMSFVPSPALIKTRININKLFDMRRGE